jgi:oxygen-independent coproporphyrinogen-3 oxidase
MIIDLLEKYDVPTPRYTSYPTVPYWDFSPDHEARWKESVIQSFIGEKGELCIYIHLPFCENLCTFCACTKRITKNHKVEEPYIEAVLKEWNMYLAFLPGKPVIREIHLGGGTPSFFRPELLVRLINGITGPASVHADPEFSIEVHPNYTTEKHLQELAALGFNRISIGVQDLDPVVQYAINRIQSFEVTRDVVDWARKYDYKSVNIDLVYGLPHQTVKSIEFSMSHILSLKPDRLAFYSYAHVPWKSKVQRRYTESDLPVAREKWKMFTRGKEIVEAAGMASIGMDHFALLNDALFDASKNGKLHRNFMGYTTTQSKLLIGLGASSISDSWNAFAQNEKTVEAYEEKIREGLWPLVNGHCLNEEDLVIRKNILDLMCRHETLLTDELLDPEFVESALQKLRLSAADGLVQIEDWKIQITPRGHFFMRNICAAIDARLWRNKMESDTFSKAI